MTIPRRLIVIEAAIPTGEVCTGCARIGPGGWCDDHDLPGDGTKSDSLRLPACRARDGYTVIAPGSAGERLLAKAIEHYGASLGAQEDLEIDLVELAGEYGKEQARE